MAKFLAGEQISASLTEMILNAQSQIILISPFLKISNPIFEALCKSAGKGIRIRLLYKEGKMDVNARQLLGKILKLETYTLDNLHSKCYLNEDTMIITSMNLYEKQTSPNREMGIILQRKIDRLAFTNALDECKSMFEKAKEMPLNKRSVKTHFDNKMQVAIFNNNGLKETKGHCIRCNHPIDYNPAKPFCYDCYSVWNEFKNEFYEEECCHYCGTASDTSMAKPECRKCYNKNSKKAKVG